MPPTEASAAAALDEGDPLGRFRKRFAPTEYGLVYLDGNSLGRLPADTPQRMAAGVDQWGKRLIRGWDESWM